MPTRLIVDLASIVGRFLHLDDVEYGEIVNFNGKQWLIPSVETSLERVEISFQRTLNVLKLAPNQIVLVKEPESAGAARKRAYPWYKSTREQRPPQFYAVLNKLTDEVCEMVMKSGGFCATARVTPATEGDDLVNELCVQLPDTIVWTGDKDLLSCPAKHHYLWDELDPIKFPVPQRFIKLYRSIVTGDASDNIPGCKGFGPAAWEKMLAKIGPDGIAELEDIIQKKELHLLDEDAFFKAALLKEKADDIYASYELSTFIHIPAHKIKWEARCGEHTKTLVTADNYGLLFPQIAKEIAAADHVVIDYETDIPERERSIAWCEATQGDDGKGGVQVDVIASEIAGMGLKVDDKTYYFSVRHLDTNNISLDDLDKVLKKIGTKRTYAHNSTGFENVVTYNAYGRFLEGMIDTRLMASYVDENDYLGLKPLSKRHLQYEQTTYAQVLGQAREKRPEVVGMFDITGEEVLDYGIDDVVTCDALAGLFTLIMEFEHTLDVFYEVEPKAAFLTSLAFVKGIGFNQTAYDKLKADNDANIARASVELEQLLLKVGFGDYEFRPINTLMSKGVIQTVYKAATGRELKTNMRAVKSIIAELSDKEGDDPIVAGLIEAIEGGTDTLNEFYRGVWRPTAELNVRSPKQLQTLLYDTLNCPVRIRNKTTDKMREKKIYEGSPSTDDSAIANAIAFNDTTADGVAALQKLVEYKGYLTRESLFLSKYPNFVHWKTGRLHCSMTQCGTNTRRFTHASPQMAQLPKKKGKEVRGMVCADDDWEIAAFDIDSQELKLAAWDCQDPNFLSAYTGEVKKDIHSMTALEVAKIQKLDVETLDDFMKRLELDESDPACTKKIRALGKATNFSSQYLCHAKKLSHMLCVHEETAQAFLDAKAAAFPGLMPHVERYIKKCEERRYSETFMGARRHLARAFAEKSSGGQAAAGRLAYSFRIQGSAAEQIKMAMGRVWDSGVCWDGLCDFVVTIHDELVMHVHKSVRDERIPIIHACLTAKYADMELAAGSTPEVGPDFGSLKKWKFLKEEDLC